MRVHPIVYDIIDFFSFAIVSLGVLLCIKFFVVAPTTVRGHSMEPTLHQGDVVVVNTYQRFLKNDIERGDMVVLYPPVANGTAYIKRVIGLPGETITLSGGNVYLGSGDDKTHIDEHAYLGDVQTLPSFGRDVFEVPEGEYFVLGDNREHSTDSRSCFDMCIGNAKPTIEKEYIAGVVDTRLFPAFTGPAQWGR